MEDWAYAEKALDLSISLWLPFPHNDHTVPTVMPALTRANTSLVNPTRLKREQDSSQPSLKETQTAGRDAENTKDRVVSCNKGMNEYMKWR